MRRWGLIAVVGMLVGLMPAAALPSSAQQQCGQVLSKVLGIEILTCQMGMPSADGVTMMGQLQQPDQLVAYEFKTPPEQKSAFIYLGDQWYDLQAGLYEQTTGVEILRWVQVAASKESGARVIQLVKPDKIVKELKPSFAYQVLVALGPDGAAGFNPAKGFTIRVALGAPVCGFARDADDRYQAALSYVPLTPRQFDLMTFNVAMSPPYTDLYDFEWTLDGKRMPGDPWTTVQVPVPALPQTPLGLHKIQVLAKGVRPYPDPDQPDIPSTVQAECAFRVG